MSIRSVFTVLAPVAAGTLACAVLASPAAASVGQCVYVYGSSGATASGYARVCLTSFHTASNGTSTAKITVSYQSRRSAPNNVYVSYGWADYGVYSFWSGRLGANTPTSTYAATKSTTTDVDSIKVRLCYAKPLKSDPCFSGKVVSS